MPTRNTFHYQEYAFVALVSVGAFQADAFQNDAFQVASGVANAAGQFSATVRADRGLPTHLHPFFTIDPVALTQHETIRVSDWFAPLSEPVRTKRALKASLQHFEEFSPRPLPFVGTVSNWYLPLAEPVRFKRALAPALQQSFAIDPFLLTQIEFTQEDKWHYAWSEPVRLPIGLRPWHQQDFIWGEPGKDYIITILDTTETPDTMTGTVTVFTSVNQADVSISTITPNYANVSSAYAQKVFADVGLVTRSS